MTKKIYYIFTLIGSLLLSSCDSYLDIQPVGQVIPNTLAEYRALFTTAYNTALNDRGICEIRTDIATILQSDATSKNSLGDVEKWNDVNPNASTRQFGWAAYYTNIYYANAIIDKKDEISSFENTIDSRANNLISLIILFSLSFISITYLTI